MGDTGSCEKAQLRSHVRVTGTALAHAFSRGVRIRWHIHVCTSCERTGAVRLDGLDVVVTVQLGFLAARQCYTRSEQL